MSIEQTLMRFSKSVGGLTGGRLRTESSQKLWLLTLNHFSAINKSIDELTNSKRKFDYEHPDLKPTRIKEDLKSFEKVFDWLKKIEFKDTEPEKLVFLSSGVMCSDNTVNCSTAVGIKMQKLLDGGNFMRRLA